MRSVVRVLLTSPRNTNVIQMASADGIGRLFTRQIADLGCNANYLRQLIAARGAQAVLPSTTSRKAYDT